jgi:indole-3-glycerol phosphate synthase
MSETKVLERIVRAKRAEIIEAKARDDEATTVRRGTLDVPRLLMRAPGAPLRLIAEVKFKSPSAGELSRALDANARADRYARAGAHMVSVLCDAAFFGGGWNDLAAARAALDAVPRDVPLLAKEFILDEVQIDLARTNGADAVLLIVRILGKERLASLYRAARARDLWPLVEITDESELDAALACEARIIGVNARDLDTLQMDAARTARVVEAIPRDRVALYLSGIKTPDDVRAVARSRADGALVGETLMREADPSALLASLVAAAG